MDGNTNMKTIEQEWERYMEHCYPYPIPDRQKIELRQTFVAGAMTVLAQFIEATELPEEKQDETIKRIIEEVKSLCQQEADKYTKRN